MPYPRSNGAHCRHREYSVPHETSPGGDRKPPQSKDAVALALKEGRLEERDGKLVVATKLPATPPDDGIVDDSYPGPSPVH